MKYKSNLKEVEKDLTARQERAVEAVGLFVKGATYGKTPVGNYVGGGNLRASNDYRTEGTTVIVGNTAEYAGYVHEGTRYQKSQPFLKNTVMSEKNNIKSIIEKYMKG